LPELFFSFGSFIHPYLFAVEPPGPEKSACRNVAEGAAAVELALTKLSAMELPGKLTSLQEPQ
jgi:hypothetical protein